jgi:hypothetical protein
MKKPDCYYYGGGYCDKAAPFTPCEFKGCVAYTDHKPMTLTERKEEWLGKVEEHRKQVLKMALTWQDIRTIDELLTLVYDPDNEKDYYTRVLEEFNKRMQGK